MSTITPTRLSEIEGAIHLRMTPNLLRDLSARSVKFGENRKLAFIEENGVRWYERAELEAFDKYLQEPWPKRAGAQRPNLPASIKREIMLEASGACPICTHDASGEAAHIEPVAKTLSHHPANLIWLCPNHHSMVDSVAVARNVTMITVKVVKELLVERKLRLLKLEHTAVAGFLQLIREVERLTHLAGDHALAEAKAGIEAIANIDVATLGKAAAHFVNAATAPKKGKKGKAKNKPEPLQVLAEKVSKSATRAGRNKGGGLAEFATTAVDARSRFLVDSGLVDCPVCLGQGVRKGMDCAACQGDGAVGEEFASRIDPADFNDVDCPICRGTGQRSGVDCPECGGEGHFERRFLEWVDPGAYEEMDCPLCEGTGKRHGDDCPECHGERQIERRFAERIDLSSYDDVDCPLCVERGYDPDCPVCDGNHQIEGRYADRVDLADYRNVDCKLCEGSGRSEHGDCPACGGEGGMDRRAYDNIEWSRWDVVDCPKCDGSGQRKHADCRPCRGEGRMYREQTWYLD